MEGKAVKLHERIAAIIFVGMIAAGLLMLTIMYVGQPSEYLNRAVV